jgi:hypothetical protein
LQAAGILALISVRHGLRSSEFCSLEWDQFDLARKTIRIWRAKDGDPSTHYLSNSELRALRRLLRENPLGPHVFVSERGGPVNIGAHSRSNSIFGAPNQVITMAIPWLDVVDSWVRRDRGEFDLLQHGHPVSRDCGFTARPRRRLHYPRGSFSPVSWTSRFLRWTPMVAVGKWSYSWYLWHWPLLAIGRAASLGIHSMARDFGLALSVLVLSAITYRWLEQPIRIKKPWPFANSRTTVVTGIFILVSVGGLLLERS